MKISRRSFLGKSLKTMAVAALAPVIVPLIKTKSITANPVPPVQDKGEVIKVRKWKGIECNDYSPQITIQDYRPGETIEYQGLGRYPSCKSCMYNAKCTCNSKEFQSALEYWSRNLQERLCKETFLSSKSFIG
jgi:hypothetical protein